MTNVLFCESFRTISDKVITRAEPCLRRRMVQTLSAHFVKEKKKRKEKKEGLVLFTREALAKMERAYFPIQEGQLYPQNAGVECPLAVEGETARAWWRLQPSGLKASTCLGRILIETKHERRPLLERLHQV